MTGSNRCTACGINYPNQWSFRQCPIHGTDTFFNPKEDQDEDWDVQLARLKERTDPKPDSLDDVIPLVTAEVSVTPEGKYFVSSWDVFAAVKRRLEPTDLIQVGKQTFEVLRYIDPTRQYWVRPISITLTDEDLARLTAG